MYEGKKTNLRSEGANFQAQEADRYGRPGPLAFDAQLQLCHDRQGDSEMSEPALHLSRWLLADAPQSILLRVLHLETTNNYERNVPPKF